MKKRLFLTLAVLLLPLAALPAMAELELDTLWTWDSGYNVRTQTSCFSPDDSLIIHTTGNMIYVRDALSGDSLRSTEIEELRIRNVVMTLDGEYLFVSGESQSVNSDLERTVFKLNFDDLSIVNEYRYEFPDSNYYPEGPYVKSLALSNDGTKLFVNYVVGWYEMSDPEIVTAILAWNITADTAMNYLFQRVRYFEIAHSPVDNILAISKGEEYPENIELYNSETFEYIRTLENSDDAITELRFSSDGQYIASGSSSKNARVWNVNTGELYRQFIHYWEGSGGYYVLFIKNSDYFYACGLDSNINWTSKIWKLNTSELVLEFPNFQGSSPAISSDGSLFFLDSASKVFMYSVSYGGDNIFFDSKKDFNMFPNPASDILNINLSDFTAEANAEIYNVLGSLVATHKITGDALRIDISALPAGVYYLRMGNRVSSFVVHK